MDSSKDTRSDGNLYKLIWILVFVPHSSVLSLMMAFPTNVPGYITRISYNSWKKPMVKETCIQIINTMVLANKDTTFYWMKVVL